jgi:hypothetical protein
VGEASPQPTAQASIEQSTIAYSRMRFTIRHPKPTHRTRREPLVGEPCYDHHTRILTASILGRVQG